MGYKYVVFPAGTRFLVTGGAGFIGSNLCEALLKAGCRERFPGGIACPNQR